MGAQEGTPRSHAGLFRSHGCPAKQLPVIAVVSPHTFHSTQRTKTVHQTMATPCRRYLEPHFKISVTISTISWTRGALSFAVARNTPAGSRLDAMSHVTLHVRRQALDTSTKDNRNPPGGRPDTRVEGPVASACGALTQYYRTLRGVRRNQDG